MVCVRTAWLTMGSASVPLEDRARGYFCEELTLGSPTVRDNVTNRPDQDGADDRTQYAGPRTVSAKIAALRGAGARIDEIATMFGPYMRPDARPTLHYVLDRGTNPERELTLRGSAYEWSVIGADGRDIHLQWVAPDPVAYDPVGHEVSAWAGTGVGSGRSYDRRYNRTYTPGGMDPTPGVILGTGDLPIRPTVRIYGPITDPYVTFAAEDGGAWALAFDVGYRIDAGEHVTVDTQQHAAYAGEDVTASVLSSLDWPRVVWPVLPPGVPVTMALTGENATHVTQATASWRDGYYG
jgi:hypothetical protein